MKEDVATFSERRALRQRHSCVQVALLVWRQRSFRMLRRGLLLALRHVALRDGRYCCCDVCHRLERGGEADRVLLLRALDVQVLPDRSGLVADARDIPSREW